MTLTSNSIVRAVLAAAFFFGAAAPSNAQVGLVASGGGVFVAQNQATHLFGFAVVERPDGSVRGHLLVVEPATQGYVLNDVTSYLYIGDTLFMAGTILRAHNAPAQFVEGATGFFAVNDNGNGGWNSAPDQITSLGVVPSFLGNLTAQQIFALIGPPPAAAFAPLLAGNLRIR